MSNEISNIQCKNEWGNALKYVFSSLASQYYKNEVTVLDDWQEEILDENVNVLNQALNVTVKETGLPINQEEMIFRFKDLIKRLWTSPALIGGAGELVLENKNIQYKNDFKSFLSLILGLLLIILAFIRIDIALKNTIGTDSSQTLQLILTSIQTAFAKTTFEQNTILDYMYYLFFNICQDYLVNQGEAVSSNMMSIGLYKVLPEYYDIILNNCGFPNLKGADITTWSGFLKYANFGASTITNAATLNSCIVFQSSYWAEYKAKALPVTIMTEVSTVGALLATGSYLIANNLPYLYTRLRQLTTNIVIKNDEAINKDISLLTDDELMVNNATNSMSLMKIGGKRKSKKKARKSRKVRKSRKARRS